MFKTKSPEVLRNMDPETFNDLDLGSFVDPEEQPRKETAKPKDIPLEAPSKT